MSNYDAVDELAIWNKFSRSKGWNLLKEILLQDKEKNRELLEAGNLQLLDPPMSDEFVRGALNTIRVILSTPEEQIERLHGLVKDKESSDVPST